MNGSEAMNWKNFKDTLLQYPRLELQFSYASNQFVDAAYHITEIKQAEITSVDCGGVLNTWSEVVVQLWVPDNETQLRCMKVEKALSIIDIVERALPLRADAIVKIEFGDAEFDTRQMLPGVMIANGESLTINLMANAVQCKAIERGGSCGTNDKGEECCTPVNQKPKIQLANLAAAQPNCTPGSGCC